MKFSDLHLKPRASFRSVGKGAIYMLLGIFFFAVSNIYIEPLSKNYPLGQIIFLRGLFFVIPITITLPLLLTRHLKLNITSSTVQTIVLQGLLGTAVLFFLFYGFSHLSVNIATTICFCEVFILTVCGVIFLKERYEPQQWFALICGFSGVVLIAFVETSASIIHILACLACLTAICLDSIVLICLKKLLTRESILFIWISYGLFSGMGGLIFYPFETWNIVTLNFLYPLLSLTVAMSLAQFFLLKALKDQQASLLSTLIYTQILWSLLFTSLEGKTMPSFQEWIGIILIIGGGFFIYFYSHKRSCYFF